ncbi:pseudouridine-5'-phosphate glycosidase [Pleomorphomonas oryzae]|uniref:pseudouridine-5'-phosphate glycosidase n=1 Tax=Pleomorphomonas oryzae TaxID=261934 RepID=UPI0004794F1C|nr:pseudouridine-5'-phosphate glycosidase [Pleomorphomonas oryzae]
MMASLPLVYSPEVEAAIAAGKPVVALESTIVTHGMPYPDNVETARAVEAEIRNRGAVPATIAVLEGKIRVGLDAETLDRLGTMTGVMKLSRADLAFALATGRPGSTTVAATMICARLAGIDVFATGGIGGVHQGAEESFDISADLEELGRTSVIVVAAGAKAILDLPKTLEVLETKGVPVVGYRTDEFPAFWSRGSGLKAPLRLDSAAEIAAFQKARETIGIDGGMLIANPVPETDEIPAVRMQGFISASLASAKAAGISAKEVTPYLLADMFERTAGSSLKTNIALVMNNARLAADVAKALKA